MVYKVGQMFEGSYTPDVALWCDDNDAKIVPCEGGFMIKGNTPESPEEVFEYEQDIQQAIKTFQNNIISKNRWRYDRYLDQRKEVEYLLTDERDLSDSDEFEKKFLKWAKTVRDVDSYGSYEQQVQRLKELDEIFPETSV